MLRALKRVINVFNYYFMGDFFLCCFLYAAFTVFVRVKTEKTGGSVYNYEPHGAV